MLGYKGVKEPPSMSSLLEIEEDEDSEIPIEFSWSPRLSGSNSFHRDQGACGSCWAVAAAQVVEDHLALHYNETYQLSMQHLVSCTPNPDQCGGTGGCQGATSELAFKYIQDHGIAADAHWPYTSGMTGSDGTCSKELVQNNRFVKIGSYVVLPENKQAPLLKALYQQGPVVVSVAASNWQMYSFGVFSGCSQDAIINHAVVAEGFGKQISDLDHKEHKYFLIKNSWGDDWGEEGYMKLKRFDSDTEHCGIDKKPQDGTGCKNGPSQVRVCGMCGILYDSAYPLNPEFVGTELGGVYSKGKAPKALARKAKALIGKQELPLR
jgi:cathepsin L